MLGKSSKTILPTGGAKWWFTMLQSKIHNLKNKSKQIYTFTQSTFIYTSQASIAPGRISRVSSNVDEDFPNLGSVDLRGWLRPMEMRGFSLVLVSGGQWRTKRFYVLFQKELYYNNLDRPTTFDWSWCAGVRCGVVASDVHMKSWDVNWFLRTMKKSFLRKEYLIRLMIGSTCELL